MRARHKVDGRAKRARVGCARANRRGSESAKDARAEELEKGDADDARTKRHGTAAHLSKAILILELIHCNVFERRPVNLERGGLVDDRF